MAIGTDRGERERERRERRERDIYIMIYIYKTNRQIDIKPGKQVGI
jgi:hypothetical protein